MAVMLVMLRPPAATAGPVGPVGMRGDGARGGSGGSSSVHDIGNAHADASSSVVIDDITTGDAIAHQVNVDARGATRPVVVAVAGSFPDTSVDVFAPGGNAQAGTTGGNGLSSDASGGDGGDGGDAGDGATGGDGNADARGGAGGSSSDGTGAPSVISSGNSGAGAGTPSYCACLLDYYCCRTVTLRELLRTRASGLVGLSARHS